MSARPSRPALAVEAAFLVVVFGLLTLYSCRPNWDIDIYWHIKAGEWIASHGTIPDRDVFSAVDQDRPWTPFQWLYEVLVYEVEARAGFPFVRALHAALFLAAFAGWYRTFRREVPGRVVAAFLLVLAVVLSEDRLRVRPEAFNFFFLALLLPDLLAPRLGRAAFVRMGGVAAVWANLHAGGALLLPLCSLALLAGRGLAWYAGRKAGEGEAGRAGSGRVRADLARLAVTTLPMLPMPGFLRGVHTAFSMYQESAVLIPEWHPPAAYFLPELSGRFTAHHAVCGAFPYLFLFLMGGLLIRDFLRLGWREAVTRRNAGWWGLAWLLALLAVQSARFVYLDAVAAFLLVMIHRERVKRALASMGWRLGVVAAGGVLAGISFEYSVLTQRGGLDRAVRLLKYDHEPGEFPEAASDAIAGMGLRGRIFHFTRWGGYLIYRHYPACTVFTDGRGNFTPEERDDLVRSHRPFERDDALEEAWAKYRFDIVVFPPPVFPLLTWDRGRWMLAYRDEVAEVFLRRGPGSQENEARVLRYWARMGVDARGGVEAFQTEYERVLGSEFMSREKVRHRALSALERTRNPDREVRASGLYDLAMIWFSAARYRQAEAALQRVLDMGFHHSTASLYVAWSRYLVGDEEGARRALWELVRPTGERALHRDRGPLKWAGYKILGLLSRRLGLPGPEAGREGEGESVPSRTQSNSHGGDP